jgi:hypothetical protein
MTGESTVERNPRPAAETSEVRWQKPGLLSGRAAAEAVLVLARAHGLSEAELRQLVASWGERRWPR